MGTKIAWGGALLALALLGGCAHRNKTVPPPPNDPYRIGREDVLDVSVWRDPDLSRTVPVRPDGFISLPMAGEVEAAGKTPTELEALLRERLRPYVQEPKLTVIVREVNSTRVFVTGEVARPGAYPIRGRMSVLQAIAVAGGFSEFAHRGGLLVIRREKGTVHPVDYGELIDAERAREADFYLMPGDTVVVP
jgi:polysaccharide biosynthesis/export protein